MSTDTAKSPIQQVVTDGQIPGATWLAGYARSGAALIRTILANCFGHQTASIYPEHLGEVYKHTVGSVELPITVGELQAIAERQGVLTVKTHELPTVKDSNVPTIVIVRDGRRVIESLKAFYTARNEVEVSMRQMIEGDHLWGSWTVWVKSWAAACRPDAMWLRYEDVMRDVPGTVDRLAARFGITPIAHEVPPFGTLKAASPTIFRAASMTGNGGMTPVEEERFWQLHGATMTMLGYQQ